MVAVGNCVFILAGVCLVIGWSNAALCGKQPYSPHKFTCCGKEVIPKTGTFSKCCNGKVYNSFSQMCCGRKIYNKDRIGRRTACCESKIYNSAKQICCDGKVQNRKGPLTGCCEGRAYNPEDKICCSGVVRLRVGGRNSACCRTRAYNTLLSVCCNGVIRSRSQGCHFLGTSTTDTTGRLVTREYTYTTADFDDN